MIRLLWTYLRSLDRKTAGPSLRRAWKYWRLAGKDGLRGFKRLRIALSGAVLVGHCEAIKAQVDAAQKLWSVPRAFRAAAVSPPSATWTARGGQA